MLDRAKLAAALHAIINDLFIDLSDEIETAEQLWRALCADPTFKHKVKAAVCTWPMPSWDDPLGNTHAVALPENEYSVLSVDGSQIYPDRHHGVSCYLINIGSVGLYYGMQAPVFLSSHPYIFAHEDDEGIAPTERVNCVRQQLELQDALAFVRRVKSEQPHRTPFLLFDGSLVFWHLEAKDTTLRDMFLTSYLQTLDALYRESVPIAGYISAPKSRELVNLIRLYACNYEPKHETKNCVAHLTDASIARFFLKPYERSIVFKSNAQINSYYPPPLHPHFFYVNMDDEIARIEIPAYVAHDAAWCDEIARIARDQAAKGHGYPAIIAEAHEQAVVKGPDREFFYQLLMREQLARGNRPPHSRKMLSKRSIGI